MEVDGEEGIRVVEGSDALSDLVALHSKGIGTPLCGEAALGRGIQLCSVLRFLSAG